LFELRLRLSRRGAGRSQGAVPSAAHHGSVPRISVFYGIVITMYFYDHEPPHFHAQYAEHHAVITIETGAVLVGGLPKRALKLVCEWAVLHRAELEANWRRAKDGGIPEPIDPLP
jgi:Domain of unknown function (DUF4160)